MNDRASSGALRLTTLWALLLIGCADAHRDPPMSMPDVDFDGGSARDGAATNEAPPETPDGSPEAAVDPALSDECREEARWCGQNGGRPCDTTRCPELEACSGGTTLNECNGKCGGDCYPQPMCLAVCDDAGNATPAELERCAVRDSESCALSDEDGGAAPCAWGMPWAGCLRVP